MTEKTGCVFLVGAGCGGPELMTVGGLALLRQCDVLVYDDLIDHSLLEEVPREARRIYMGKRRGSHSAAQAEICRVLVEEARAGNRVVRLKGGDPFVFGRGGEEAQALRAAGVPYEEVPGISSAIAIPAAAGIPVTHRGLSRSVHIITGHTADGELSEDGEKLAGLKGTLVFLMGLSRLEKIAGDLLSGGKAPDTPAAVISGGNTAHPAVVRGTLAEIAWRTREAQVQAPAVIVVGAVAALDLSSTLERPLRGIRAGMTGTDTMAARLRAVLEPLGASIWRMERAEVRVLPVKLDFSKLVQPKRWLVFTSANGVETFFRRLRRERVDLRRLAGCRIAVIGAATGAVLEQQGLFPDLCPEAYTSEALAQALLERVSPEENVVLLRAREGTPELPALLRKGGLAVTDIPIYTVSTDLAAAERAREALNRPLDYLLFSSAGGVRRYFDLYGTVSERTVCVCIGAVTAQALRERHTGTILISPAATAESIGETVLKVEAEKKKRASSL